METISVRYDSDYITNYQFWPSNRAQQPPIVEWSPASHSLYTVIMYDLDAPYPNDPHLFLHWLVVNVPGNDIDLGQTVVSYLPPSPPNDSPPHQYVVAVYRQRSMIYPDIGSRSNLSLINLVRHYGLSLVGKVYFRSK